MSEADGKTHTPRVCVDLDGVLNMYDGWKGEGHFAGPRPGAVEFLQELNRQGYDVAIFTSRDPSRTWSWLDKHHMSAYVETVFQKLPAMAYVDDRAVRFDGDFQLALGEIQRKPHWKLYALKKGLPWKGETCRRCGREQRIAWSVIDELWEAVVPEVYFEKTLCLECFFQLADAEKVHVAKEDFRRLSVVAFTVEDGGPGPVDRPTFIGT